MKTKVVLFSLLAAVLVLTACPYQSSVPISEANQKLDKKLMGKWIKESDMEQKNPEYFEIQPVDKYKFNIVKFEYQTSDSAYKETKYLTHITKIDDNVFLNMQENGQGDYFLHKIDLQGDKFILYEITDNIDEKFNTSAELYDFVKKYMNLSFFYNKDETTYIRDTK
jgi:HD-GYP domain-containing protein (c-di-GMP phosphodiesterase class II)